MAKWIYALCLLCLGALPSMAQRRVRWIDLSPFERAVLCIKHFEGWHGREHYPYVGYGYQLKKGEKFTAEMTEQQADYLLRADHLWERFELFKGYGKEVLLLTLLPYNVGVGRLLGYGKQGKSRLIRKIEQGDRHYYKEYRSFCLYKGKILRGLLRRRKAEFLLFYVP